MLTHSHDHEVLYITCRLAKLPERGWHILRHSFATHAAMFGVNQWTLNAWLGRKAMEEMMRRWERWVRATGVAKPVECEAEVKPIPLFM